VIPKRRFQPGREQGTTARVLAFSAQNDATLGALDAISTSGFNNLITYHTGSPSIDKSGNEDVVQQG
jgi:Protein of unknown function (DUF3060)